MKTYTRRIKALTRWQSVKVARVSARSSLWEYGEPEEGEATRLVEYIVYKGQKMAVNRFISRWSCWGFDFNCEEYPEYITGHDGGGDIFRPLLCACNPNNGKMKLYADIGRN